LMRQVVGQAVRELRRQMEWDQAQLAKHLQRFHPRGHPMPALPQETISRWESGRKFTPSADHRLALAKITERQKEKLLPSDEDQRVLFDDLHIV
jgi:transcriptional regulator with XRE-family HTH domain